jgi:hypothetical protein
VLRSWGQMRVFVFPSELHLTPPCVILGRWDRIASRGPVRGSEGAASLLTGMKVDRLPWRRGRKCSELLVWDGCTAAVSSRLGE